MVFGISTLIILGTIAAVFMHRLTLELHIGGPPALQERLRLAQCRATCLEELGLKTPSQEIECRGDKECYMCWEVCGLFYDNFTIWGPMCTVADICNVIALPKARFLNVYFPSAFVQFPGCQVACSFKQTNGTGTAVAKAAPQEDLSGVFADPPRLETMDGDQAVRVTWTRPLGHVGAPFEPALVYVLLLRGVVHRDQWEEATQTQYQNATLSHSQLKQASELEIVAFSPHGPCARTRLNLELDNTQPDVDTVLSDSAHHQDLCAAPRLLGLRPLTGHKVEAQVSWECTHRSSHSKGGKFEVTWKELDSAVDVTGRLYTSQKSATLPLWPDTSYSIFVRRLSPWSGEPEAETQALLVDTFGAQPAASAKEAPQSGTCVSIEIVASCAAALSAAFIVSVVALAMVVRRQTPMPNQYRDTGKSPAENKGCPEGRSRRGSQLCTGAKAIFRVGSVQGNDPSSPVGESQEDLLGSQRVAGGRCFVYDPQAA